MPVKSLAPPLSSHAAESQQTQRFASLSGSAGESASE